jgi:hypothetical protein
MGRIRKELTDKGKPAARRGRKATGPLGVGWVAEEGFVLDSEILLPFFWPGPGLQRGMRNDRRESAR